ncbi:MAG TPA: polysaccharide deacetylase family protein [Crocinitomicaceae bacterium]|nr:polysaccharide deacetylase family protein [Crocinitomicaceae bacterium]
MRHFFKTPIIHRWFFYRRIWGFSTKKKVYLTFDDGPTKELTNWILDYLKKENIKATFFCVGENAKAHPELIERMVLEGHVIGNHTMHHEKGTATSKANYLASIEEASQHIDSSLFRPPYGRMWVKYSRAIRKKYKIIMWSWLSYDYDASVSVDTILSRAKKQIKGGDIIVLHDNLKVEDRIKVLLPELVKVIRKKGLGFEKIEF